MKMRKIFAGMTALAMMATMAVPAMATLEGSESATAGGATPIDTKIVSTYTVTIPNKATVAQSETTTTVSGLGITAANLVTGASIDVTAVFDGTLTNTTPADAGNVAANEKIAYTVADANDVNVATGGTIATFDEAGDTANFKILTPEQNWTDKKAGTYNSTITFTFTYDAPAT